MAKKRDVIVAVVIVASFVLVVGFFGLMMIGLYSGDGEMSFSGFGDAVGVVEMFGVMTEASGRPVIDQLDHWRDNHSVRAIVIHVNSPGGEVAISQEIYDAILRVREDKPVVVSMAGVAASGGYYISCAADKVVANPGTLTGSIGVIFSFHTFKDLMEKWGISTETIKSGDLKDVGSFSRDMTEKEELMLRSVVMDTYEQFVGVVAEGRSMEKEEVYPFADGSIFTGLQAYNLGLVDTLGGLNEAVLLAAELADMGNEPSVVRPRKREQYSLMDMISTAVGGLGEKVENSVSGPRLMFLYR